MDIDFIISKLINEIDLDTINLEKLNLTEIDKK